jgi:HAT1-interacting factor 1
MVEAGRHFRRVQIAPRDCAHARVCTDHHPITLLCDCDGWTSLPTYLLWSDAPTVYDPSRRRTTQNVFDTLYPANMAESSNTPAELPKTKEKLEELKQKASLQYSLKEYSNAADHYADAVEIQAALNGEMAPENAELLFYYGRALYKVAIAKSDVLGAKVAQEEKKQPKAKKAAKKAAAETPHGAASDAKDDTKEDAAASKPFFQLTGDENWTDSEDEEEGADGEQEEEEDDFANAYEIFDIARVLYEKRLEELVGGDTAGKGKEKAELTPEARSIKEKLADCHGFLVEISFENERFHDALLDARAALALQEELHPFEHENVNEAHYSLSLALEFASVSKVRDQQAGRDMGEPEEEGQEKSEIDWDLRNEAAKHTQLAIDSLETRLKVEEAALGSDALAPEQKKEKEAIIQDKKGMLEDLKTRVSHVAVYTAAFTNASQLADLKEDPTKQQFDSIDPSVFQGLLGGLLGADSATQKAKLAEATKSANDISGLVKTRKKEKAPAPAASGDASSSKRKLDVADDGMNGKRAKTEEMQ